MKHKSSLALVPIGLVLLAACQQAPTVAHVPQPLSAQQRGEIETIAVAAQPGPPDVSFRTASRGRGAGVAKGAGRGAVEGAAGGLLASISAGPMGVLLIPVMVPLGAVFGGVVGGTVEGLRAVPESTATQAETDVRLAADQAQLETCLKREAADYLSTTTGKTVVTESGSQTSDDIDAVLELGIEKVGFAGAGGSTPDMRLLVGGYARIRMSQTGEMVFDASRLSHVSPQRPHSEWAAQPELIRAELEAACRQFARAAIDMAFVEAR